MPLFIGGPLDGRLLEVEEGREIFGVATEHALWYEPTTIKPNKLTDIFYYKRETLDCPTISIPVYVPRSYTCKDVMESLIEGYRQSAIQNSDD